MLEDIECVINWNVIFVYNILHFEKYHCHVWDGEIQEVAGKGYKLWLWSQLDRL